MQQNYFYRNKSDGLFKIGWFKNAFLLLLMLSFISTTAQQLNSQQQSTASFYCVSDQINKVALQNNPEVKKRLNDFNQKLALPQGLMQMVNSQQSTPLYQNEEGLYEIPIVVHVIHAGEPVGTLYNKSDQDIIDWVNYTNASFLGTAPGLHSPAQGGYVIPVKLVFAKRTPDCQPTTGILRVNGALTHPNYANDGVNLEPGGIGVSQQAITNLSRWDATSYYNIYITNKFEGNGGDGGAWGFAAFAGTNPSNDHTFVKAVAVQLSGNVLVHEIGHALGLFHTFQGAPSDGGICSPEETDCALDGDMVCDTERSSSMSGLAFPTESDINPCTSSPFEGVQYNIMNYTPNPKRFTQGQSERAIAALLEFRMGLLLSKGAKAITGEENNVSPIATCVPTAVQDSGNYAAGVSKVVFGTINNPSSVYSHDSYPVFYENFIGKSCYSGSTQTELNINDTTPLSVTVGWQNHNVRVYIDYNNNGVFDPITEMVMSNTTPVAAAQTFTQVITHPTSVVLNTPLRMRVIADHSAITITPCGNPYIGQVEDYTVIYRANSACDATPSGVTVSNITVNSAKIDWVDNNSAYDIEWGLQGFTQGTGTSENGLTANTYLLSGIDPGTTYDFYVRQICNPSAGTYSNWSKVTFSTQGYCSPVTSNSSPAYGFYINSLTTTGNVTNITNSSTGYTNTGYRNYSASHSASQHAGESFSFSVVTATNQYAMMVRVYVDTDKNGVFDASEVLHTSGTFTGTYNGSFNIPSNIATGNYKMRIILKEGSNIATITSCSDGYLGEVEDYTLTVLPPVPCPAPSALSATVVNAGNVNLSWTSSGNNFDIEWGVAGFTQGSGTVINNVTATQYSLSNLTAQMAYDVYVRQNCTSSNVNSSWSKAIFTTTGYCTPWTYQNSGDNGFAINSFITSGGTTNISNLNTGFNAANGGYNNYSATHSVSQHAGEAISFSLVPVDHDNGKGLKIWIDTNKNGIFDTNELVYSIAQLTATTNSGTFTIPGTTAPGNYRMRVMLIEGNITNIQPCATAIFGEIEDYTFIVTEALPCTVIPSALTASSITVGGANISWIDTTPSADLEWGIQGFTQGTGNEIAAINANNYQLSGLAPLTSYDVYVRAKCEANSGQWVKYTFTTLGYCTPSMLPASGSVGMAIRSFTTTGGVSNINNINSGFSTQGYGNFAATHAVTQHAGEEFSFLVVPINDTYIKGLRIWIDFNQNGVFDTSEIIFTSSQGFPANETGTFLLPLGLNPGNYIMRVVLKNNDIVTVSPCEQNTYGETEDYMITVLPVLPCTTPTQVKITNTSLESVAVNWTGTGNASQIEWGTQGFTLGTGTQVTVNSGTSHIVSGLASETYYDLYIRQNCLANGYSNWAKHTFRTGYCFPQSMPTSFTNGFAISSFSTTQGVSNISNINSGYSSTGYGNFSATHSVVQHASEPISFTVVPSGTANFKGVKIWVDKNKNGLFDSAELVHDSPAFQNSYSASFNVDLNLNPGNYRMRVMMIGNLSHYNPCNVIFSGEVEDYTLTVLTPAPCPSPSGLTASGINAGHANLSWTSTGNNFDIEWGLTGFSRGTGTIINNVTSTQYTLSNLTAERVYDVYVRQNCTASSNGYGNWSKVTFATTGYCTPWSYMNSPDYGIAIQSFTTSGGVTNINNLNSVFVNGGYTNYSAIHSVSQHAGEPISYTVIPGSYQYTKGVRVWLDINKNGVFDSNEQIHALAQHTPTVNGGTFSLPVTMAPGDYRMRVMLIEGNINAKGPCDIEFFGEIEDYRVTVLPALPCTSVSNIVAVPTAITAALSWTSTGNLFEIEWGVQGFQLGTGTQQTGITATNYSLTGLEINTPYDFYVRRNCASSSNGYSNWLKYTFRTLPYCVPSMLVDSPTYGMSINSFRTTRGVTNINNTNSGYSTPRGYGNFTATHSLSQHAGEEVYFSAVPLTTQYTKGFRIWVDWNKNGVFDTSEIVFTSPQVNVGTHTGLFAVPFGTQQGNYRMRIVIKNNDSVNISPCEVSIYGETEDYTLNVLEPLQCTTPTQISHSNATLESVTINWTGTGNIADIEWGVQGFTLGTGTQETGIDATSYNLSGLTNETYYDFYVRQNCSTSGYSGWAKYTFRIGYCIPQSWPASFTLGNSINSFATSNGVTNITNMDSGYSSGGYGNFVSTHSVSQYTGEAITFSVIPSGTANLKGFRIWIDLNKNGVFEPSEAVYASPSTFLSDHTGSFNIDSNWSAGNYRMRVMTNSYSIPTDACSTLFFGEAEDYTLTILPAGSCITTIWNGATWSNGIPDMNRKAVINAALTLTTNLQACELTVTATGKLTIPSGLSFTVNGQIVNEATVADVVVASGANLVQLNDVANTGEITVRRNSFDLYRQDYTLWSSPVAAQNLRSFSTQTLFSRFYSYNTGLDTVGGYEQELFTTADTQNKVFNIAKGYLIRMPNNWPVYVNNIIQGTQYEGEFKGVPQNGTISMPLSTTNTGMNLVGNPYPSAISISDFFAANPGIDQTIYFWRKRNNVAGSGYATYTNLGLASPQPEIDGLQLNNTINVGQGFFIKSTGATTVNFNNQMRSSQNSIFMRSSTEKHRIWLNLSDTANVIGQTLLGYATDATQGVDNGLDGIYFNESPTALTSLIGNKQYAVQARSLPFTPEDSVPLSFKTDVAGTYSISLSNFDGLFSGQDIYLKDDFNGQLHDLKASAYTFATSEGIFDNRFSVVYQSVLNVDHPQKASEIIVYKQDTELHFESGNQLMQKIEIFDIRGRLIHTLEGVNANTATTNNLNIASQALIVRIHMEDSYVATKKIIY